MTIRQEEEEQTEPCSTCACAPCDCEAQYAEVMEEQAAAEAGQDTPPAEVQEQAQWLPEAADADEVPFYDWGQA